MDEPRHSEPNLEIKAELPDKQKSGVKEPKAQPKGEKPDGLVETGDTG